MLTCETAETLVVREADDLLTPAEQAGLAAHAADCETCRALRDANLAVKRAVGLRVDAPVPNGFAARVSDRVMPGVPGGWLSAADWRRWTEWMLPVAAALVLIAVVAGSGGTTSANLTQRDSTDSPAVTLEGWAWSGDSGGTAGAPGLSQDVTNEDLLAAMLGARLADMEGNGNGR